MLVSKQGQCIQTQAASQHRRWHSVEAVIAGGMSLYVILSWMAEADLSNGRCKPILRRKYEPSQLHINTHAMMYLQLFDFFWVVIPVLVLTARL